MRKLILSNIVLFLMVLGISSSGFSTPLNPGDTIFNPGYGLAGPQFYTSGGVPLGNTLLHGQNFGFTGAFGGNVQSNIYSRTGGLLTFEYIFTHDANFDLVRATIGDVFTNPWLNTVISDAGADGSGSSSSNASPIVWTDGDPNFLLRDPTISGEGVTIQWRVASGGTTLNDQDGSSTGLSSKIWFETDAKTYTITNIGLIDSGAIGGTSGFAPGSPIPEPGTIFLLGTGLISIAGLARRKQS